MLRYWTFLEGYAKWAVGKRRPRADQERILHICAACEHRQGVEVTDGTALGLAAMLFGHGYSPAVLQCGQCKCLIGSEVQAESERAVLTISGRTLAPAGKIEVEGEQCPIGRW